MATATAINAALRSIAILCLFTEYFINEIRVDDTPVHTRQHASKKRMKRGDDKNQNNHTAEGAPARTAAAIQ